MKPNNYLLCNNLFFKLRFCLSRLHLDRQDATIVRQENIRPMSVNRSVIFAPPVTQGMHTATWNFSSPFIFIATINVENSDPGMYACRICAVNYWFQAYYNLGQNAADNATFVKPSCEPCPANARCGGGLCLPVPMMGYWSQGVDRSTTNPDGTTLVLRRTIFQSRLNQVLPCLFA